jgi:hydroxyacylglutathione hydrolase
MLNFQTFIGGIFDTNGYLLEAPTGNIVIDAPTGSAVWLEEIGIKPDLLLITHGHVDHIDDAASIKKRFNCKVAYHPETIPLIMDPEYFKKFGFFLEAEPVKADFLLDETPAIELQGVIFQVLSVPGHCPGSICFYAAEDGLLFGGDVLFSGSIGRADLPGGDYGLLIRGIHEKIFPLPDRTRVLSGHGPETTIGEEKRTNPYLQ